jgi:glutamate carboxypeptidase
MPDHPLIAHLSPLRGAMLDALEQLVVRESPSRDKLALDTLAGFVAGRFESLGLAVERVANEQGGSHLRIRAGGADPGLPPALVLAHLDTVWPVGTLAAMPFRVEHGRAHGPGAFDMKASLVLAEFALSVLRSLDLRPRRPVVLLITSDEEIGSPTSRALIEDGRAGPRTSWYSNRRSPAER